MTAVEDGPAGWRLTVPVVNLPGPQRAGGSYVAAIADESSARRAIPFGRAVPSARLQPVSQAELDRYGVAPGEVLKVG
ncbi:hypothetical protein [Methylopila turkensis]|uniref:Uncharacterized protein n=1 Tax=Methylopila turkensis TaxID=1437816 RepID=A0A9W6JNB0_9HYPH|nr:hypothetical protein [Methylopila turkensis]GLK79383.1 hypothetical protein GCM10008174_11240 [Methylopila turkensis]